MVLAVMVIILAIGQALNRDSNLAQMNYRPGNSAVVKLNHNRSTLNPHSWRADHVRYAQLDRFQRNHDGNGADLDNRNVAHDTLRQRQFIYPSGWHQKMIDHQLIVNRGHLIAYSLSKGIARNGNYRPDQLSGDQNNPDNLFTQTAFSNQKLQTIYESKVRQALYQHKRVIFKAQPIFRGHELMARGVHLQAVSTDRALNFNVYLFNVQPGVKFDYMTGEAAADPAMRIPVPRAAPRFHDQHSAGRSLTARQGNDWQKRDYRYRPARRGRLMEKRVVVN